jgi:Predicted integral membrane protein
MENQSQTAERDPLALPLLLAAAGGGLMLGARSREGRAGNPFLTLAGIALVGIASHRPLANALKQLGTRIRSADSEFSFVVDRPVEQVFAFFADFENFPKFIGALREVRDTGDGRSHWCASTPRGGTIEWSSTTTKFVTNSVIGWRSVPGSPVEAVGLMRFSPEGGSTCVKVALSYRVLDGGLAETLAALVSPYTANALEEEFKSIGTQMHVASGPVPALAEASTT